MTATSMTEDQAVNLVRNALLIAAHEMGKDGDHWPVIKATVFEIMKDHENLRIERNVFAEVKTYVEDLMRQLQQIKETCPDQSKPIMEGMIEDVSEIYKAGFTPIDIEHLVVTEEDYAPHLRRADAIIKTLEEDHVHA